MAGKMRRFSIDLARDRSCEEREGGARRDPGGSLDSAGNSSEQSSSEDNMIRQYIHRFIHVTYL